MRGSTILADLLYEGLMRGDDPRSVLHHLRLCLRAECSDTHDWASVVAYAAMPPDFDEQVREARQQQSQRAINVAFSRVDELMEAQRRGPGQTPRQMPSRKRAQSQLPQTCSSSRLLSNDLVERPATAHDDRRTAPTRR